jgi:oxygen-independent coproporphyrinogen-3 oxidase
MRHTDITTVIDGERISLSSDLIEKYDRPLPRYTSYPPAPAWKADVGAQDFVGALARSSARALSLYVHLPFCRTRCTFCACNAIATSKTDIVERYIDTVISEMDLIRDNLLSPVVELSSIHWGGGTPTFLTERQMRRLMEATLGLFSIASHAEVGIEADPRQTSLAKVELARELGFNRISFGVQDTNPIVQAACGRVQDMDHVTDLVLCARKAGFESVNVDLCYGLPAQDPGSFRETISDIVRLSPDRIALFNFAYVPWTAPHQRKIDPASLPAPRAKLSMFTCAIEKFLKAGYRFIGLDHFAKEKDELTRAQKTGALRRTFQGYTAKPSSGLIGVGVSAISEISGIYVQNERRLSAYFRATGEGRLPVCRGYRLTDEDNLRRFLMQKLFCSQRIDKKEFAHVCGVAFDGLLKDVRYEGLVADGLVRESDTEFKVTPLGRLFVRNIAALFDVHLVANEKRYSRTV